jgi:chromosome segregation ATPase
MLRKTQLSHLNKLSRNIQQNLPHFSLQSCRSQHSKLIPHLAINMDQTAPSSILWATQLRQENIHLVNKMDQINGILTSAMGTIETLNSIIDMQGERIERLEKQRGLDKEQLTGIIQESNAKSQDFEGHSCKDNMERFEEVSERTRTLDEANFELTTKVNVASDKLVALQTENATLRDEFAEARQKLRKLETDNATLKEQIGRVVEKFGVLETESRPLKQDLVSVLQTFETTQSGNAELKQRVCVLEKELSVQEKRVTRVLNWMSLKTMLKDTDKQGISVIILHSAVLLTLTRNAQQRA